MQSIRCNVSFPCFVYFHYIVDWIGFDLSCTKDKGLCLRAFLLSTRIEIVEGNSPKKKCNS